MIDLNKLSFEGEGGLLWALAKVADHRKPRGVRYSLASVLTIMTAATLAGSRSVSAIGEWAADCPQEVLARMGAKYHPLKRRYIAPHTQTFRNILKDLDCVAFDQAVGHWLFEQVRQGHLEEEHRSCWHSTASRCGARCEKTAGGPPVRRDGARRRRRRRSRGGRREKQ